MLPIQQRALLIRRVEIRSSGQDEEGKTQHGCRVHFEFEPDNATELPEVTDAVRAIVNEQNNREIEGKDTITIRIKREFTQQIYDLSTPLGQVTFPGDVVLQPTVQVIHGSLRVRWTAEATLDAVQVGTLAGMVGNTECMANIFEAQGIIEFPGEAKAASP